MLNFAASELPLIPKQHFMVHYPQQILCMGPIINSWNMRNESKLKLCKKVSKFGNFKNICCSVAMKHQRWMCLQLQSKNFLEMPPANGGNSKICLLSEELPDFVACFKAAFPNVADSVLLQHYMWAKFHHYMYRKGGIVIAQMPLGESPTFGKILDIVCANEQTLLFLELYRVINFDDHYHAYSVESMQKKLSVSVTNLPSPPCFAFV